MHAWEQIQKTLDHIEEHLSGDIKIESLAKTAALSSFYYQRLFSRLVGKPVAEYIKLRRMAKAADALLYKDKRILDVALDMGYASHEQFTRTFKQSYGITPKEFRKSPVALNRMNKPDLLLNYTLVDENVPLVSDGVILEIKRKRLAAAEHYIGMQTNVPIQYLSGLGIDTGRDLLDEVWSDFHARRADIPNLLPHGDEIGVSHVSGQEGFFCYFAGAQADSASGAEGFEGFLLPQGEYIVCSFEAEDFNSLVMDALYKALRYLFEVWLPKHSLAAEPFSVERYASHDKNTKCMEIWVMPVAEKHKKTAL